MLPGLISSHYTKAESTISLPPLCSPLFTFIHASATGVVMDDKGEGGWVMCDDGRPGVWFDVLGIDVGGDTAGVDGKNGAKVRFRCALLAVKGAVECRHYLCKVFFFFLSFFLSFFLFFSSFLSSSNSLVVCPPQTAVADSCCCS